MLWNLFFHHPLELEDSLSLSLVVSFDINVKWIQLMLFFLHTLTWGSREGVSFIMSLSFGLYMVVWKAVRWWAQTCLRWMKKATAWESMKIFAAQVSMRHTCRSSGPFIWWSPQWSGTHCYYDQKIKERPTSHCFFFFFLFPWSCFVTLLSCCFSSHGPKNKAQIQPNVGCSRSGPAQEHSLYGEVEVVYLEMMVTFVWVFDGLLGRHGLGHGQCS